MEELPGAPVGTDRSRVALGRSKKQMPGQEDRTVRRYRNPELVSEPKKVIRVDMVPILKGGEYVKYTPVVTETVYKIFSIEASFYRNFFL